MSAATLAKHGYARFAHGAGHAFERVGVLGWLDRRRSSSRLAHWLRSLPAIHDLEAMVELDVPWWTYDAIEEVDRFLASRPGARVFEYGSGASTMWLRERAALVRSVEHHAGWHANLSARLAAGRGAPVELTLVEPDAQPAAPLYISAKEGARGHSFHAYVSAIERTEEHYDLVVVDGRARAACLHHAVGRLAPGGMVVFDNSGRARYREAIETCGLQVSRLRGLAPSLPYPDETALLRSSA